MAFNPEGTFDPDGVWHCPFSDDDHELLRGGIETGRNTALGTTIGGACELEMFDDMATQNTELRGKVHKLINSHETITTGHLWWKQEEPIGGRTYTVSNYHFGINDHNHEALKQRSECPGPEKCKIYAHCLAMMYRCAQGSEEKNRILNVAERLKAGENISTPPPADEE